jgi:hypothetical protein
LPEDAKEKEDDYARRADIFPTKIVPRVAA